jgi:hypothetical protein
MAAISESWLRYLLGSGVVLIGGCGGPLSGPTHGTGPVQAPTGLRLVSVTPESGSTIVYPAGLPRISATVQVTCPDAPLVQFRVIMFCYNAKGAWVGGLVPGTIRPVERVQHPVAGSGIPVTPGVPETIEFRDWAPNQTPAYGVDCQPPPFSTQSLTIAADFCFDPNRLGPGSGTVSGPGPELHVPLVLDFVQ